MILSNFFSRLVTFMYSFQSCEGIGPSTPPSPQHSFHFQAPLPVPCNASHVNSPPSSEITTPTGGLCPVRPSLVNSMVILRRPAASGEGPSDGTTGRGCRSHLVPSMPSWFGSSIDMTMYTLSASSMIM